MRVFLLALLLFLAGAPAGAQPLTDLVCGPVAQAKNALGKRPALDVENARAALVALYQCEAPAEADAMAGFVLDVARPDPATLTTFLADALWHGAPSTIRQLLVTRGAEPETLQEQAQRDLAWRLAQKGDAESLDWLLEQGWALNTLSPDGFPPLYFADENAVRLLLERGADPRLQGDVIGTVLTPVVEPPGSYPGVDLGTLVTRDRSRMLVNAGFPVNLQDIEGHPSLQWAVATDNLWLVQYLLQRGADPDLHAPATDSVLAQAVHRGRLPVVQALLRAQPTAVTGQSELLLDYIDSPEPDPVIAEALLVAGAVPGSNDNDEPALVVAARRQHWDLIPLLLEAGADPNATNAQGCTLHCYTWAMPEALRMRLEAAEEQGWKMPALETRPGGFFMLAVLPVVALWLLRVAQRLARREPFSGPTLQMLLAVAVAVIAGGALFFQCDPCVIVTDEGQLALTGSLALGMFLLLWGVFWVRRRYS